MKLKKLNSDKLISVNISKYRIDWDGREISKPQTAVRNFLRPFWEHCSVYQEMPIPGSKLRLDFFNANGIVIEVSPAASHTVYTPFLHKSRPGFLHRIKSDEKKRIWSEENGFIFCELGDFDIKNLSKELFAAKGIIL